MAEVCLSALWSLVGFYHSLGSANALSMISKVYSHDFGPWDIALGVKRFVH